MGTKGESEGRRLALGRDVRFLLVAVGGGGIRVGREIARRKIQYLETAAVNCDRRVYEEKLFDRKFFVKGLPGDEEADGDTTVRDGSMRALAAQQELSSLFQGATCTTIVASLGGGSGSGILPVLIDLATQSPDLAHLTLYLIAPFAAEEKRRRISDQTMGNLWFLDGLTELNEEGRAHIVVLDNETTFRSNPQLSISGLSNLYAGEIAEHVRKYISISNVETMVSWLREGQVIGSSVGIPRIPAAQSNFLPLEQPSLSDMATARLSPASATPPGTPPPHEVELLFEAESSEPLEARPKIPPTGPVSPRPPEEPL